MLNKLKKMLFAIIKIAIFCAFGLYLLLCVLTYFFADKLAYPAPKSSYCKENFEHLEFVNTKQNLKIATLFLKNSNSKNLIIYSHGNGEDLGEIYERICALHSLGFNIIAYDYYGYGLSDGKMKAEFVPEIADAVWDFAISKHFEPQNITLMGYSMGSAPSCYLAAKKNPKNLIIEGGFASAFQAILPKNPLPWNMLCNAKLLKKSNCPILIFHGKKDRVVPFYNGEILYRNANSPKFFVRIKDANHFNIAKTLADKYPNFIKEFALTSKISEKNLDF